jgi:hypothetical protein
MSYFTKASVDAQIRHERSLATTGLEYACDVNIDDVTGAGGQGDDVFRAERNDDKLPVPIKVTRRSKLTPGLE